MNGTDARILELENEKRDLRIERDEPETTSARKQAIDARIAEIDAELALLNAQSNAGAATPIAPPD